MSILNADTIKQSSGKEFIVEEPSGLLAFLLSKLGGKSRNNVKSILSGGAVSVDGEIETRHDHPLYPGQCVRIAPPGRQRYKMPERLKIIYEDDELIAVNKPAGLLTVATGSGNEQTAYRDVTDYVRRTDQNNRIFIVHRLDRDTSGVVLFAKTERIKRALQDSWSKLVETRGYTAVAEGTLREKSGSIVSWLKETKTHRVYSSPKEGDGKKAVTAYQVLRETGTYSLLRITLETGRKNQIRAHLREMGHPVAGDKKYGASTNPLGRLALHAETLVLNHPDSGRRMVFHCEAPGAFGTIFLRK